MVLPIFCKPYPVEPGKIITRKKSAEILTSVKSTRASTIRLSVMHKYYSFYIQFMSEFGAFNFLLQHNNFSEKFWAIKKS